MNRCFSHHLLFFASSTRFLMRRQLSCSIHMCNKSLKHEDCMLHQSQVHYPVVQSPLAVQVRCYAKGKDKGSVASGKKKGTKPKVVLTDEEMAGVIDVEMMKAEYQSVVDRLKESYIKALNVRQGVGIEDLIVKFDGEDYPLKELAVISRKASNLIIINCGSNPEALKQVEEAINNSGMNVTPQLQGTQINIQLPRVTREHREALAKNAKIMFNKAKDELSKVMAKYVTEAKDAGLIRKVSQELVFNTSENVRYLEAQALAQCDAHLQTKLKELLGDE